MGLAARGPGLRERGATPRLVITLLVVMGGQGPSRHQRQSRPPTQSPPASPRCREWKNRRRGVDLEGMWWAFFYGPEKLTTIHQQDLQPRRRTRRPKQWPITVGQPKPDGGTWNGGAVRKGQEKKKKPRPVTSTGKRRSKKACNRIRLQLGGRYWRATTRNLWA